MSNAMVVKDIDDYYTTVKEGFLDVKNPHQKKSWKSWTRKWVVVRATKDTKDFGGNDVLLQFFASSPKQQEQRNEEQHRLELRGTISVFRCDSKSRACRAFGVLKHGNNKDDGATSLVYLAGEDERHSEVWMAAIRNALLPPSPLVELEEVWQDRHRVSLIDTMYSFQHGLLGTYGYLSVSGGGLSIIHPHIGQEIAKWPLKAIVESKLLRVDYENAASGVFAIVLVNDKPAVPNRHVLAFYSPTARSAVENINAKLNDKASDDRSTTLPKTESYGKDLVELGQNLTDAFEYANGIDESKSFAPSSDHKPDDDVSSVKAYDTNPDDEIYQLRQQDRSTESPTESSKHFNGIDKQSEESAFTDDSYFLNKRVSNYPRASFEQNHEPRHSFTGISSVIFDHGATSYTDGGGSQNETSRTSSGSSDSTYGSRDSPSWPQLWEEFFFKQEERLANLNLISEETTQTRYANLPTSAVEMSKEEEEEANDTSIAISEEMIQDKQCIDPDTGEIFSAISDDIPDDFDQQRFPRSKRVSLASVMSQDSHIYADISSLAGYHRSDSFSGQTLYEEMSDEECDESPTLCAVDPQSSHAAPPLPPPRQKTRRPSALKLMELSDSIEIVLSSVERSTSAPGTPEKRRKASPTTWLNPVKSFKKILTKEKKKGDEGEGKSKEIYCSNSPTSPKKVAVKVKRATSQPIFYYDRTELRKKPIREELYEDSSSSDDETHDLPQTDEPKSSDTDREEKASVISESPDYSHWSVNSRQICLEHLLEKLKKGETADFCDCTYDSRERSRTTLREPNTTHLGRRPSKSLTLDVERHLKILHAIAAGKQDNERPSVGGGSAENSTRSYGRQESSEYCDMTPPTNRRRSSTTITTTHSNAESEDQITNDDYVSMRNLSD